MAFKRFTGTSTPLATISPSNYTYSGWGGTPTTVAPAPAPEPVAPSTGGILDSVFRRFTPLTPTGRPASSAESVAAVDARGGGGAAGDPFDKNNNGIPDYIEEQKEQAQRNALALLKGQFAQYGITDATFVQYIHDLLVQGYDATTISIMLQDHRAYKERFAGNELRRNKGLGVLSPAEYIATEAAYAQVLRAAGLPPGFYDDPKTDFADWIGRDVSPNEIKTRADMAAQRVHESDPSVRQALAHYYGITEGTLAAYYLDDKRALPILQRQAQAAEIGAAASRQGLARTARTDAELFADQGVTTDQAQRGYSEIGNFLKPTGAIARRFQTGYEQTEAEQEIFGGLASARRKRERLYDAETSLFRSRSGVDSDSLKRSTSGSY